MYYGARYYDPKMSLFISVDPLAEQFQGWSPYNYTMNNPLNWTDPTGMAPDDWIDINKKTGGIKITKSEGADVVRLVDDGKVVDSYEYGENGSFRKDNKVERNGLFERTGYKVHFQDATKADKFFKLAAKSDVEFASMNFFFGDNVTGQSTVLTSGSSQSVSGTAYAYEVLRENPDAYLLNFSHSHPGKYNPKTNYPAAPSGFNYTDLKTNNYNGDRQRYLEGSKEFGNRIPHYFNIYIPGNPNVKVKHNGQKAIRTITR